jgi:hypothetical protein
LPAFPRAAVLLPPVFLALPLVLDLAVVLAMEVPRATMTEGPFEVEAARPR